ncbi:MAG: DUF2236 domain-containing protein [Alphaproteobacteria bacterium]|nr:DUF2236 domain-containing protein [Alphaproteobacteria bacterium]
MTTFLSHALDDAVVALLGTAPGADFLTPQGALALCAADSVSWRVFKNPVALFVGGITAVLLELAEPRVREGVWRFSDFRRNPVARMRRTGMAAMVTVYAARERAEKMILDVNRMHARVTGTTPNGELFCALDTELLNWVQATASFGFLTAYSTYVRTLSAAERDQFYREALAAARLYGAVGAPAREAELFRQFDAMYPRLERSDIIQEFLQIVNDAPVLPRPLRWFQQILVRAAISLVPEPLRIRLGLKDELGGFERRLVRFAGQAGERIVLASAPPAQACRRLGLPDNYLYRTGG